MTALFKNLLGNGSKNQALSEEMRAVLDEMRQERGRLESLLERARTASEELQRLGAPIAQANAEVNAVSQRLGEIEERFQAMVKLTSHFQGLDDRAEALAQGQHQAETRLQHARESAEAACASVEELGKKIEKVVDLQERLDAFLETEKPFQQVLGEFESVRSLVDGTGEHVARLREQHERLMDAHKVGVAKMEALDRRREELSRDLQDKERRVANVEQVVQGLDGIRGTVDEVRREITTVKALGDAVSQKAAILEAQREAMERALTRAEQLERATHLLDAGVQQQERNEKSLNALHEQVATLRALHETVVDRSSEISQLQRVIDEQAQAARQNLAVVRDQMKNTVERFDFESKGLESVSQRVADLRSALSDFEIRFRTLTETGQAVGELHAQTQTLAVRLESLSGELDRVDGEASQLAGIRRDLDGAGQAARDLGAQVARLLESAPEIQSALGELGQLRGARALVKDTLEQAQVAHGEITRLRDSQAETRTWLGGVEQFLGEVRDQVADVRQMAPMIDAVQKKSQRISESTAAVEARREFIEGLQNRMADLVVLGGKLDERGMELLARMEAAEQRFAGLEAHSEEADEMAKTVNEVSASLRGVEREASEIGKRLAALNGRCETVEKLAERSRKLREELEQRESALEEASKDLDRVSEAREEAAAVAQQLEKVVQELGGSLQAADKRSAKVEDLLREIEGRTGNLRSVEARLGQFEGRLAKWELVEQELARSLEQIAARQNTVESLKIDLDRMSAMAEKTANDVRSITSSHREVEESRTLLEEVMGRLTEIQNTESSLNERKRQLARAEERLARADALLSEVRSSLEALQGQKVMVEQAVERAGSLKVLLKQAEAMAENLREERKMTAEVRAAVVVSGSGDDEEDLEEMADAA
jgi:DNA repair exonuclease SbcCD ATPase subunit